MKKRRYSDAQIVWILRETDSGTVAELVTRHGVSEAISAWRKKMQVDKVKRLKTRWKRRTPDCISSLRNLANWRHEIDQHRKMVSVRARLEPDPTTVRRNTE